MKGIKMVKIKAKYIVLYAMGIILLIFGQRNFWEEIQKAKKQKETAKKQANEARIALQKKFEIQTVVYDSLQKTWKNEYHYFQTIHVGNVNFKALKKTVKTTRETHDDENTSDSF